MGFFMKMIDLGRQPFKEVWEYQKELVRQRIENKISDTLILVEHDSVITKGRNTKAGEIFETSFPIFEIERGGKATYHGPGQLVCYPIMNIYYLGIKKYMRLLEEIIINIINHYNILSNIKEGKTGVWVKEKKIASIGIAVKKWISYHGFALNVSTDLSHFSALSPCGFESDVMTSIEKITQQKIALSGVKEKIRETWEQQKMDRDSRVSAYS